MFLNNQDIFISGLIHLDRNARTKQDTVLLVVQRKLHDHSDSRVVVGHFELKVVCHIFVLRQRTATGHKVLASVVKFGSQWILQFDAQRRGIYVWSNECARKLRPEVNLHVGCATLDDVAR